MARLMRTRTRRLKNGPLGWFVQENSVCLRQRVDVCNRIEVSRRWLRCFLRRYPFVHRLVARSLVDNGTSFSGDSMKHILLFDNEILPLYCSQSLVDSVSWQLTGRYGTVSGHFYFF